MKKRGLWQSFREAGAGFWHCLRYERSFRIHVAIGALVLFLAFFFQVSRFEFLILLSTIIFVLGVEMLNTALESVVDLVTEEHRKKAKIAKDVAAGVVLVVAMGAAIIGLAVFVPYVLNF